MKVELETNDYSGLEPVEADYSLPKAYVVDINGTLAHMTSRGPHDYHRVGEDEVDDMVATMVDNLAGAYEIILLSGRKDSCREETTRWLEKHYIPFNQLLMRAADDNRVDWQVKYDLFNAHVRDKYNVMGVFDDRDQCIRLWREIGLKAYQVAYGDF